MCDMQAKQFRLPGFAWQTADLAGGGFAIHPMHRGRMLDDYEISISSSAYT